MNTLEKLLGAATVAIAIFGAVLTLLGVLEAGVVAACLVALCGLFLLAQLLRESRRHKRALELLREADKKSRAAIASARAEGAHAHNDILGHAQRIRADLKDHLERSDRRDAAPNALVGTESVAGSSEPKDVAPKLDARSREIVQQVVDERAAIISEIVKSEERVNEAIVGGVDATATYQQLSTQKLVAQQDGLRRVVDLIHHRHGALERSIVGIEERVEAIRAKADEAAGRQQLEGVAGTVSLHRDELARLAGQVTTLAEELEDAESRPPTADALSELESTVLGLRDSIGALDASVEERLQGTLSEVALLTENARALSDQVLGVGERLAKIGATRGYLPTRSLLDVSERIDRLRLQEEPPEAVDDADVALAVAAHRAALDRLRRLLHEVRSSGTLLDGEREKMLGSLYSELGMQDVTQEHVLDVSDYEVGVSFRAQMVRLMHLKENLSSQGYEISPRENDKMRDRAFAQALGVSTPSLLFQNVPTGEVVVTPNSIVKPEKGESSQGVFFVRSDAKLVSFRTRNVYSTFEEASVEYLRRASAESDPRWLVESAVLDEHGNPARDVKVFMFYGKVGLYREIVRFGEGAGSPVTAAYDADGQRIAYRGNDDPERDADIPAEVAELAERISYASPVPFLRVDFLVGTDGPVLGEITPHPGGIYAGDAFDNVDRELGRMFLDADARLTIDLIRGKSFEPYLNAYGVGEGLKR